MKYKKQLNKSQTKQVDFKERESERKEEEEREKRQRERIKEMEKTTKRILRFLKRLISLANIHKIAHTTLENRLLYKNVVNIFFNFHTLDKI